MTTQYATLLFDIADGVARITLNRPEAKNSINLEMGRELLQVALQCSEDRTIRTIVLTASGKIFCPGGDIKAFATQGSNLPGYFKGAATQVHAAISLLSRMEVPIIIAVNGVAAGAGMSLALIGDIVLAANSARFVMAYTQNGLTPDAGATYFLPRIVGLKRALELTLTNRELSAKEALDLGIVTRVVPDDELARETAALAAKFANGATKALCAAKRLLYSGWTDSLESHLEREAQSLADMGRTQDGQAALQAFVEKRVPKFTGQ